MKRGFGYLKKFQKGNIVMDSSYCDHSIFKITNYKNCKKFYPDAIEELPHNMPTPFGKKAQITIYIDADHAHDTVTQRSVTAIILFIKNTPMR
jgi:primosomal protein N'